ncbi:hypothetical protein MTR_3g113788 [Medicago truncatula]|uniref:Uncharacterized protein n=1 Tax=Medicago truncatula TaxID=3880 RepID=A0A072V2I0_MEDTR|nr:hypothetical protein MTR_3g113788 [Medicago truncatula]
MFALLRNMFMNTSVIGNGVLSSELRFLDSVFIHPNKTKNGETAFENGNGGLAEKTCGQTHFFSYTIYFHLSLQLQSSPPLTSPPHPTHRSPPPSFLSITTTTVLTITPFVFNTTTPSRHPQHRRRHPSHSSFPRTFNLRPHLQSPPPPSLPHHAVGFLRRSLYLLTSKFVS